MENQQKGKFQYELIQENRFNGTQIGQNQLEIFKGSYIAPNNDSFPIFIQRMSFENLTPAERDDYYKYLQNQLNNHHNLALSLPRLFSHYYGHKQSNDTKEVLIFSESFDKNLHDYVALNLIPEQQIIKMILPIVNSIATMHKNGYCHRNISTDSFSVKFIDNQIVVKLTNFRYARNVENNQDYTSDIGQAVMLPLEMLNLTIQESAGEEQKLMLYKADVWSVVCILYYIMYKKLPFSQYLLKDTLIKYKNHRILEFPQNDSKLMIRLNQIILEFLNPDYEKRKSLEELFNILKKLENDYEKLQQQINLQAQQEAEIQQQQ